MDTPRDKTAVPSSLYDEAYFRTACEGYDEFNASEGVQLSRRLASAFAHAQVKPGMKVLEVTVHSRSPLAFSTTSRSE